MSTAARQPYDRSLSTPASYPIMVDRDGAPARDAVRAEVRALIRLGWSAPAALARVFQKVRLQRKWALAAAAAREADAHWREDAEIALRADALIAVQRANRDVSVLTFLLGRYQFGSLAHAYNAGHMRAVYGLALQIAIAHAGADQLIAAE